jgi:hypothetical protein
MRVRHQFSITDKHVNGVERTLAEISRHARAIVFDERIKDIFADPMLLPAIQYILNSEQHSETGFSPFELMFGTDDKEYFSFPPSTDAVANVEHYSRFVANLNANLQLLRQISLEYQTKLAKKRISETPLHEQNTYQPGDYVLFDMGPKPFPKLHYRYKGPYEVIQHVHNSVTCRHLVLGFVEVYDVASLILFPTDYATAYDAALRDRDQYVIARISGHRGDLTTKTNMEFYVEFADGDHRWLPWTLDLDDSIPFEEYVSSIPELYPLKFKIKVAAQWKHDLNKKDITTVTPGDTVYVLLQWFNYAWYQNLQLPNIYPKVYVVEACFSHWYYKQSHRKISDRFPIFPNGENTYVLTNAEVFQYFSNKILNLDSMVLVDKQFVAQFPHIVS